MPNTSILNPSIIFPQRLPLISNFRINLKVFWIATFILIIFFLAFYVFQVNALVSESYIIQNYEKKISELSRENKNLEISLVQVNSLENIEILAKNLGFEKVDKIHYIRVLESSVVTK